MNRLKKTVRALRILLVGLLFKRKRGTEWEQLTQDRYPYIMILFAGLMVALVIRIVLFIFSADGAVYRKMAQEINPPRSITETPLRGTIHDREGHPVAITSPYYRLFLDFNAPSLLRERRRRTPCSVLGF